MPGELLRWAARRLPGVEPDIRPDLVESVDLIAATRGPVERAAELVSLVGCSLRTMSRRGASDDPRELVRQGVRVGALVLVVVNALVALELVGDARGAAVAVAASATAVMVAGGLATPAVVAAAATVSLQALVGTGPTTGTLIAVVALALGRRFDATTCPVGAVVCAGALAAGAGATAALPPGQLSAVAGGGSLVASVALLGLGWFDPRLAVGATVALAWRFLAVDLDELAEAVGSITDRPGRQLLVARWLLMGLGVGAGWCVSQASLRRTTGFQR